MLGAIDYYSMLARRLSAAELAGLAARRAWRAARVALHRRAAELPAPALLSAFSSRGPEELPARLRGRAGLSCCELSQRERVLAAVQAVPGAAERALERAERAMRRELHVFGRTVSFGPGGAIAWSRDPGSGFVYPSTPASELLLLREGVDPKDVWELGRLEWLLALGQGAWVAPERRDRYAAEAADQLTSFLEENPCGVGVHWTCAMEVSLRGANLARALSMLADAPAFQDGGLLLRALRALAEHANFVEANLEDQGAVPNNHLVADYAGLLVMGLLFPELPGAARKVALSAQGLREQMESQVHPDGVSFEGSVPYHRLALELFTLAFVHARDYGVKLGQPFAARLWAMYQVALRYTSERGLAPQLGDNDSGLALGLADRGSTEHGYLASLGAALFGAPELRREGEPLCDEAAWLLGERGLRRFSRAEPRAQPESFSSPKGGLHVLRGGGGVVSVSAGENGQRGLGGHSHNDKLSFELHVHGEPVIVDPGTGTYTRDPALRNALRGTAAHSTVQVDGAELAPLQPARLFALPEHAGAKVTRWLPGASRELLTASHRGYPGVEVERTFVLDKERGALAVTDLLRGAGVHSLVSRLQLPDARAQLAPLSGEDRALAAAVGGVGALVETVVELPRARVVVWGEGAALSLEQARCSPGYGRVQDSLCVAVRARAGLPVQLGFVILWDPLRRGGR